MHGNEQFSVQHGNEYDQFAGIVVRTTSRKHKETMGDIRDLGGTAVLELNWILSGGRLIGNPGRRAIAPAMSPLIVVCL